LEKGDLGGFKKAGSGTMKKYNPILKKPAKALRKSMTDAERTIWAKVRGKQIHGLQFYRQKPLLSFIVDFYCPKAKLVIELDGGQHFTEDQRKKDRDRDSQLAALGLRVLRFNNRQVFKQIDAVMALIWHEVGAALKIPPDPPLPKGGS
jgi:very-short-patch-repair endonuclease